MPAESPSDGNERQRSPQTAELSALVDELRTALKAEIYNLKVECAIDQDMLDYKRDAVALMQHIDAMTGNDSSSLEGLDQPAPWTEQDLKRATRYEQWLLRCPDLMESTAQSEAEETEKLLWLSAVTLDVLPDMIENAQKEVDFVPENPDQRSMELKEMWKGYLRTYDDLQSRVRGLVSRLLGPRAKT